MRVLKGPYVRVDSESGGPAGQCLKLGNYSHYSERMGERTSPQDSLERLAWHLNFLPRDQAIPLNRLAEETGLAWATVKKYVDTLETLQRISPVLSVTPEGIEAKGMNPLLREALDEPEKALAVYLFTHAKAKGQPTDSIPLAHIPDADQALHQMEALGWIETTQDGVRLTPMGVSIAADAYTEVMTAELGEIRKRTRSRSTELDPVPVIEAPHQHRFYGPHPSDECQGHGPAGFAEPSETGSEEEDDHETYITSNVAATS